MRLLVTFFLMFVLFAAKAETSAADSYASGDGSTDAPYQISNLAELRRLSETTADWDKHFILTADIDARETPTWNSGAGFLPIGNSTTKFAASFNGNGFVIDSLCINRPSTQGKLIL